MISCYVALPNVEMSEANNTVCYEFPAVPFEGSRIEIFIETSEGFTTTTLVKVKYVTFKKDCVKLEFEYCALALKKWKLLPQM